MIDPSTEVASPVSRVIGGYEVSRNLSIPQWYLSNVTGFMSVVDHFGMKALTPHSEYDASKIWDDISIWKLNTTSRIRTNLELDDGYIGNTTDTLLLSTGWGRTGCIEACKKKYDADGFIKIYTNEHL
ncbi:hypothetical protein CONCODRAFT_10937 [Conidiobolus coronatus NRRL 28638]|uniref:Uncharacterized protein n=1 Tax=Conidiobolus coronatus (strain ATCC 28846 / CBS 209.66 / NRRL 28638) TaxID=796925 RepID=A0A137NW89_CONC2|nr:hypothetical protein CONCODRAFT_10937 [Conidiobolus coronatus NRRL 28638]|eukprot:KXN67073.1 hypothetical protein CONCODRAFT_10937 [Conidiobolus coronatus NRRL 28638]